MKEQVSQTKKRQCAQDIHVCGSSYRACGIFDFSILAAITFGNADLSLKDVYSVIAYKLFHIKSLSVYAEGAVHDVVWLIRLPRVLLALAVGMALSVCGVVMQAIVRTHWQIRMYLVFHPVHPLVQHWRSCLSWWISRWKLSWCYCIYWCNGHFFCSNCHCKHGRKKLLLPN